MEPTLLFAILLKFYLSFTLPISILKFFLPECEAWRPQVTKALGYLKIRKMHVRIRLKICGKFNLFKQKVKNSFRVFFKQQYIINWLWSIKNQSNL